MCDCSWDAAPRCRALSRSTGRPIRDCVAMAATVREALLKFELRPVEIPRPKCTGMEFVPTIGRQGFYKSIRNEGHKYGIHIKDKGPKRPTLPDFWQSASDTSSPPTTPSPTDLSPPIPYRQTFADAYAKKVDLNSNEIYTRKISYNRRSPDSIPEEPELPEPEPDYDDPPQPLKHIPNAPPLPPHLFKKAQLNQTGRKFEPKVTVRL